VNWGLAAEAMSAKFILLLLGVALLGALGAVVIGEQERHGRLQVEAARREGICANCARLNQENRRWRAALAEVGDLNALRNRCAMIVRMWSAIDKLELQRRSLKQASGSRVEGVWPSGANVRRASEWKFCGRASPADAVESVLWSARSGDVDHLASLITFEPGARQRAEEIFAGLTEEARRRWLEPRCAGGGGGPLCRAIGSLPDLEMTPNPKASLVGTEVDRLVNQAPEGETHLTSKPTQSAERREDLAASFVGAEGRLAAR
jgi:hypothetical protein